MFRRLTPNLSFPRKREPMNTDKASLARFVFLGAGLRPRRPRNDSAEKADFTNSISGQPLKGRKAPSRRTPSACAALIMAGNSFGALFRFMTWGESHGPAIGVVVDGVPSRCRYLWCPC